ncbi:MAG: glycosyl hydrolase [Acidobacteria bacterium]|nr:glycosyl hydrolase [Acidobacteriota bacterium]
MPTAAIFLAFIMIITLPVWGIQSNEAKTDEGPMSASTFAGLELRGIGPAVTSGRIGDFAVDPADSSRYFVAVASGGVWKTVNNGTTWTPVFDGEGSYSIGCVEIDPSNPDIIWVGTGENNSQRSVSFGDGVYKSLDGGQSWTNMGLEDSQHIGMIAIDPRDSDIVYVAAQGPLWNAGGDRGLYKTTDGGANWDLVLEISEHTGVNEVHFDPRNPDILYATAYQRRRRTWTLIDGGPESAIYKSTDAGATWRTVTKGLPEVDMGRIGLTVSPANPDVVYAIIEAVRDEGGFFRSTDRGESWTKRSDHVSGSPQYYNEIVADPADVDRVYSLETWMQLTTDGGETFGKIGSAFRHVDDHAMWIDPADPRHLLVGCDGGIYESWDRAETYVFKANLPVTQFYRVGIDNAEPFYFVYGGTQDNATLGGPSRTRSPSGIANEDWFVTVFGDGFQTRVDPEDPMIVYSEWQYGGLVRHDRRSGEVVNIQPIEPPGEEPFRWNWDAPLIISPHSHTRLYFAASRLFRSEDRGNSWSIVSPVLHRGIDRDTLEVMDRVWGPDAVAKSKSTSTFGNAVALSESPLVEGLIYVGTDDGLIWVSEDGGENWRTEKSFPGIPENTYVARLEASIHDADTVFATFDAHKDGDFKPYVLKSTDRAKTWTSIAGDLPEKGMVWALVEDHEISGLLFAGTEYGLFFSSDGGSEWIRLKGNLPTVAVRDIAVQRRESDLVLATFGRGFYILDDYSPLRTADEATLQKNTHLFDVKDPWVYIESPRLGLPSLDKSFQGDAFYAAPNPPYGAVFTYHLAEGLKTRQEQRIEAEKKADEEGTALQYATLDQLRAEDSEHDPALILTVTDSGGAVIRRIEGPRTKGFHRVAWDLRLPATTPIDLDPPPVSPWGPPPRGPLAIPGTYSVTLSSLVDGQLQPSAGPETFTLKPLDLATFPAEDRTEVQAFRLEAAELQRAVHAAVEVVAEVDDRLEHLRQAALETPNADQKLLSEIASLEADLEGLRRELTGDRSAARRNHAVAPSILGRIEGVVGDQWYVTSAPTQINRDSLRWAGEAFTELLPKLRHLVKDRLQPLETQLETAGAPWTPGRFPTWEPR